MRTSTGPSHDRARAKLRIRSILVPVDFSTPSIKAVHYAAAFAEQFGAKLTLLHVVEPLGSAEFTAAFPLVIENDKLVRLSEDKLLNLSAKLGIDRRLIEKTLVRTGVPFNEITNAARTLKADLIIIATQGNTGLKRLMLGSTTERVVRHATCPVFVLREREREIVQL